MPVFVDHIRIHAKAGDGGNGSASFRREKYVPRGGPDGGDAGKGGDIVLMVSKDTDNLREFFYRSRYKAGDGENGMRYKRHGKNGKSVTLKVPPGTLVHREDEETGERELVADLTETGQRHVLVKGGEGGLGNVHFKSATNQAPTETTEGVPGEEGTFHLELRRIADAGLVGFPNAGKSTLLTKLSAARPKVAAYPFTTLRPMVGVLEFPGFARATVADIPGLIEGAHDNVGLGHAFLRHITRCHLLLFVVDLAGTDGRDPIGDLEILRTEISLYDDQLAKQPWLIVANKTDLPEAAAHLTTLRNRFPKQEIIPISALEGEGVDALKARLGELVGHAPE
ncbi:GTPase ObgE [soil metagenome]